MDCSHVFLGLSHHGRGPDPQNSFPFAISVGDNGLPGVVRQSHFGSVNLQLRSRWYPYSPLNCLNREPRSYSSPSTCQQLPVLHLVCFTIEAHGATLPARHLMASLLAEEAHSEFIIALASRRRTASRAFQLASESSRGTTTKGWERWWDADWAHGHMWP